MAMYHPGLAKFLETYGIVVIVVAMMIGLTIMEPMVFLTPTNLTNIIKQNASAALLALGMFVVVVTAGIDLSVGSVMALAMITLAVANRAELPWPVVIVVGPLVGIACGLVNGIGLTWLKLPHPFIMTLGTLNIARGLSNIVSGGAPISGLQPEVRFLGTALIPFSATDPTIGLPASAILVAVSAIGLAYFLHRTSVGRHIYAIGGNPQAARVSGISVDRVLVLVYALCGFFTGLAALLLAGRTNSGFPNAGIGAELDAIAAVIIGGASFFGGRGTVLGVLAGVLIIGLLRNGLNLLDVAVFWQQILIGLVIIAAVYMDVLRRRAAVRT